jgi:competence protein ComEA
VLALVTAVALAASVDANKASQADLEAVKGIGPAVAGKIIEERKKGTFKNWDDLVERVKGIGEGNAAKFSAAGLTVGGASFKGAAAAPAPAPKKDDKPAAPAASPAPMVAKPAAPATPTAATTAPVATAKPAAPAAPAVPAAAVAKAEPKKEATSDKKPVAEEKKPAADKADKPKAETADAKGTKPTEAAASGAKK